MTEFAATRSTARKRPAPDDAADAPANEASAAAASAAASPAAAEGEVADATMPADGAASVTADVATYELARDELAAVVHKLESGGLGLDESLTLWERGEHLAAVCSRFLDNARERVESALARADRE